MRSMVESGMVTTDGADLYFERRGSGPALLMIPGGGGDGGVFDYVADLLADEFTVLNMDRRGNSRSALHEGPAKLRMEQQSADAVAVIAHNGFDTASVFGSSGGGVVAFDMAARFPEVIEAIVPHEAPLPKLMTDPTPYLELFDELDRIVKTKGGGEGYLAFRTLHGKLHGHEVPPPSEAEIPIDRDGPVPPDSGIDLAQRLAGNWSFFTIHEMRSFIDYVPDLDAIKRNGVAIAPAGGMDNKDDPHHYGFRTAVRIADELGVEFAEFPGGHTSYMQGEEPEGFVRALRSTLGRLRSGS